MQRQKEIKTAPEISMEASTKAAPEMKQLMKKNMIMLVISPLAIFGGVALAIVVSMLLGLLLMLAGGVVFYIAYNSIMKHQGKLTPLATTTQKLNGLAEQQPLLMEYFGVPNADNISPVPDTMYGRKLASLLPEDFDKSALTLYQYDGLHYSVKEVYKSNYDGTRRNAVGLISPKEVLISMYEPSALKKYIFRAIANMEATLGLDSGDSFHTIMKELNNFVVVTQTDNATIYLTDDDAIDLNFIKQELLKICNALQINYNDMSLGDYRAARSTWFAAGSSAIVGFAIAATAFSHLSANVNEMLFEDASVYVALNNIISHFNEVYD